MYPRLVTAHPSAMQNTSQVCPLFIQGRLSICGPPIHFRQATRLLAQQTYRCPIFFGSSVTTYPQYTHPA